MKTSFVRVIGTEYPAKSDSELEELLIFFCSVDLRGRDRPYSHQFAGKQNWTEAKQWTDYYDYENDTDYRFAWEVKDMLHPSYSFFNYAVLLLVTIIHHNDGAGTYAEFMDPTGVIAANLETCLFTDVPGAQDLTAGDVIILKNVSFLDRPVLSVTAENVVKIFKAT